MKKLGSIVLPPTSEYLKKSFVFLCILTCEYPLSIYSYVFIVLRLRNFVFTFNNYTPHDENSIAAFAREECVYLVFGRERGEQGTPHLQGYAELKIQTSSNVLHNRWRRMHMEPRRGTQEQAIQYCKKGGDFWEWGTPRKQGARHDLDDIFEMARAVNRFTDVVRFIPKALRYDRAVRTLIEEKAAEDAKESRPIRVEVYWGPPGYGKTRLAIKRSAGDFFILDQAHSIWFDGYIGQHFLIIDDFHAWIPITQLLRIIDRYQCRVPVKGGFTYARWEHVFITSNVHPSKWYNAESVGEVRVQALMRRLHKIVEFDAPLFDVPSYRPAEVRVSEALEFLDERGRCSSSSGLNRACPHRSRSPPPRPVQSDDESDEKDDDDSDEKSDIE